ncbi:hypothetical protein QN277_007842 [Acacia crassicarpa]|uniref:GTP cyclohydrolase II domain-containing protein n=1 Tax=Acacia crassicarpa TaxID=499986 RepID=A0AAE1IV90_9FABA|nr:hypothetical protein QN277_007842 [Acacia crassicarpa]
MRENISTLFCLKLNLQILRDLGVRSMKLMTKNIAKYVGLKGYGLTISGRIPLVTLITKENQRYLETKRAKMDHTYDLESNNQLNSYATSNGKVSADDSKNAAPCS